MVAWSELPDVASPDLELPTTVEVLRDVAEEQQVLGTMSILEVQDEADKLAATRLAEVPGNAVATTVEGPHQCQGWPSSTAVSPPTLQGQYGLRLAKPCSSDSVSQGVHLIQ